MTRAACMERSGPTSIPMPTKPPADSPLTLVSYVWDGSEPEAYIERTTVGQALLDRPLFLTAERYINVPLELTYRAAYRGMPQFWRDVLETGAPGQLTLGSRQGLGPSFAPGTFGVAGRWRSAGGDTFRKRPADRSLGQA